MGQLYISEVVGEVQHVPRTEMDKTAMQISTCGAILLEAVSHIVHACLLGPLQGSLQAHLLHSVWTEISYLA